MTETLLSEAPCEVFLNAWRNILVDRFGNTYRGVLIWPTENAALDAIAAAEGEIEQICKFRTLDGDVYTDNYSYAFPQMISHIQE